MLSDLPRYSCQEVPSVAYLALRGWCWQSYQRRSCDPSNVTLSPLPAYSPELNPQENVWDEIREKIFKNYALRSMDAVYDKLAEPALYIERNRKRVKSIASFPYIVRSS